MKAYKDWWFAVLWCLVFSVVGVIFILLVLKAKETTQAVSVNDVNTTSVLQAYLEYPVIEKSYWFYLDLSDVNSLMKGTFLGREHYALGIKIGDKEYDFTLDELLEKLIPEESVKK